MFVLLTRAHQAAISNFEFKFSMFTRALRVTEEGACPAGFGIVQSPEKTKEGRVSSHLDRLKLGCLLAGQCRYHALSAYSISQRPRLLISLGSK